MATPYIALGSPTTGGGKVISANESFIINGKAIACVGDKATCPKHKCVATILAGDNHMTVMGKPAAQHNSPLSCGCRCIGDQHLVVGDNGGGLREKSLVANTSFFANNFIKEPQKKFDEQIQICIPDESADIFQYLSYQVKVGESYIEGTFDENGKTKRFMTQSEELISEFELFVKDKITYFHEF